MQQIIVCDDDKEIAESIAIYLKKEDFKVFECHNGQEAIDCLEKNHIDLIVMDVMMPKVDGITAIKKIRETSMVPVIFLSAKSEDEDRINGLSVGADDYISKPFNPRELLARIKSVLKRSNITLDNNKQNIYESNGLKIDTINKIATLEGEELQLTPIEYNILLYFLKHTGKVLSSNDIYKEVWNESEAFNIENTIAVHIRHLRKKIEKDPKKPKFIKVIWGIGYKMEAK